MSVVRRIGGSVFGIALVLGLKFYNKGATHDEVRAQLLDVCGKRDKPCVSAVKKHFDACFADNYDIGTSRNAGHLNEDAFLRCFNERSGTPVFALGDDVPATRAAH
jgi:hypothetical protein